MKSEINFEGTLEELNEMASKCGLPKDGLVRCVFIVDSGSRVDHAKLVRIAESANTKIEAIKAIRETTIVHGNIHMGLREAKEFVEANVSQETQARWNRGY